LWQPEPLSAIAANPPASTGWIIRRLWPADAYGVIAAESKAGKSVQAQDLAISIATGRPFLGRFPIDRRGPVIYYCGEGGRRGTYRRLRAICEAKGIDPADVPDLHLVFTAPKLTVADHLEQMRCDVAATRPVAIVLDPLYLSLGGTSSSGLSEMGVVLGEAQAVGQGADAVLFVVHHWNQTGNGSGFGRMSGAGPEEWGRVLWSIEVTDRKDDPDHEAGSIVDLSFAVRGGEIPDANFTVRRTMWTDDPDALDSPLHYEVEASDMTFGRAERTIHNSRDRALAVLEAHPDRWLTAHEIQEIDGDGYGQEAGNKPLQLRTVKDACKQLHDSVRADRSGNEFDGYTYRARRA
jgi:RecA-family ATPase